MIPPAACPRFERWVDLVQDEVPAVEGRPLREHLAGCPSCREEFEEIGLLLAAARKGGIDPPRDFAARVLRALRESGKGRCGGIPIVLLDYHKGELSPGESQAVAAHVGACAACRADLHEIHGVLVRARSIPEVEVRAGFADRVVGAARERRSSTRTARAIRALPRPAAAPARRWVPLSAAAAVALAAGAAALLAPRRPATSPRDAGSSARRERTPEFPISLPPVERIRAEPDPISASPGTPLPSPGPLALPPAPPEPLRITRPDPPVVIGMSERPKIPNPIGPVPGPLPADFPVAAQPPEAMDRPAALGRAEDPAALVAGGLEWLVSRQGPRGEFTMPNVEPGSPEEAETTAVALLPFLRDFRDGKNPFVGRHRVAVRRGLGYLVGAQDSQGRFAGGRVLTQALCLLAVSEGAAAAAELPLLSRLEQSLPPAVARGAPALERLRARAGGFGDGRGASDPAVSAWALEALGRASLASARWPTAGIRVSPEGLKRDAAWLGSLPDAAQNRVGRIEDPRWPLLTAAALHARRTLEAPPSGPDPFDRAPDLVLGQEPAWPEAPEVVPDRYLLWYFSAQAIRPEPAAARKKWGKAAELVLLATRCSDPDPSLRGSWPNRQIPYGQPSFRIFSTAMSVLILEAVESPVR